MPFLPGPNTMTSINCRYGSDLRCTAQHSPSTTTLEIYDPTDNQGKGERFSPPIWWLTPWPAAS